MIDLVKQYTDQIKSACVLDAVFKAVKIYERKYPVVFNICNDPCKYWNDIMIESIEIKSGRTYCIILLRSDFNNKKEIPYYLNELRKLVCAALDINIGKADIDKINKIEYNEIR